jgi:HAD superfamily hydrolase (TIGR01450 family)
MDNIEQIAIPTGVVLDLDGVMWIAGQPAYAAARLVQTMRHHSIPFCVLTNDCTQSAAYRWRQLHDAGIAVEPHEVLTAPALARDWLVNEGVRSVRYLGKPEASEDLSPLDLRETGHVDAVVVGDPFDVYSRDSFEQAAQQIMNGALFVAMQRKRFWHDAETWHIDNGFWIAGLEYVTGVAATVVGKPSATAYASAFEHLALPQESKTEVAMVSDDIDVDLAGAREFGFQTIYIGHAATTPDWLTTAVADLSSFERRLARTDDAS